MDPLVYRVELPGKRRYPHADGKTDRLPVMLEAVLRYLLATAIHDLDRQLPCCTLEQHNKLLTANAGDDVDIAKLAL